FLERPAGVHPQTESSDFAGACHRRQFLARFDCAFISRQELLAIELGVGPIFGSHAANIAGRAGAESIKRTPTPVVNVVQASPFLLTISASGASEIGDLILLETRLGSAGDEFFVHRTGEILVYLELARLELRIKGSIIF